jgi:hypothetical protein
MRDDRSKQRAGVTTQPAKQRSVRRCPFVASAEVTEPSSGARLSARTSELGLGGCYIETLNPFPEGTLVQLRIVRDRGAFETMAKVVYSHANFGMGLAFTDMIPNQRSLLEDWLAELVTQLRSVS